MCSSAVLEYTRMSSRYTRSTLNVSSRNTLNVSSRSTLNVASRNTLNVSSRSTLNVASRNTLNVSSRSTLNVASRNTLNVSSRSTLNVSSRNMSCISQAVGIQCLAHILVSVSNSVRFFGPIVASSWHGCQFGMDHRLVQEKLAFSIEIGTVINERDYCPAVVQSV